MNSVLNDECYDDIEYIRGSNCSNNNMCIISYAMMILNILEVVIVLITTCVLFLML